MQTYYFFSDYMVKWLIYSLFLVLTLSLMRYSATYGLIISAHFWYPLPSRCSPSLL